MNKMSEQHAKTLEPHAASEADEQSAKAPGPLIVDGANQHSPETPEPHVASATKTVPPDARQFLRAEFWRDLYEKKFISKFDRIKSINADTKKRIRPDVCRYAKIQAKSVISHMRLLLAFLAIYSLAAIIATWLIPSSLAELLIPNTKGTNSRLWIPAIGMMLNYPLLILAPKAIDWLFLKASKSRVRDGWYLFVAALCGYAARQVGVAGVGSLGISSFEIAVVLLVPCWAVVAHWGISLLGGLLSVRMDEKLSESSPQAMIVDRFVDILADAEQSEKWKDIKGRWAIVNSLEGAACAFERATSITSGDSRTDAWTHQAGLHITTTIRSLKKKVILPRHDTREDFVRKMSSALVSVMDGNWGEITRTRPAKPQKAGRRDGAWRTLRLGLSALAPLGILLFLRENPPLAQMPGMGYLTVGCVVWIALTFIAAVDPGFSKRNEAIKEVKGLLLKATSTKEE